MLSSEPQPITAAELQALREEAERATPRPWRAVLDGDGKWGVETVEDDPYYITDALECEDIGTARANANLIVAACNLAPRLAAEVEWLTAENATVRGSLRAVICDRNYLEGAVQRLTAQNRFLIDRIHAAAEKHDFDPVRYLDGVGLVGQATVVERLAADLERKHEIMLGMCQDQCDDEERLRLILGVPPAEGQGMSVLVEMVGERLKGLRTALEQAKDALHKCVVENVDTPRQILREAEDALATINAALEGLKL